jgi:predicted dehydrogenase
MSPSELVEAYAPGPNVFGDEYIIEKGGTKAGWSTPMPDEDWTSGHQLMCQAFMDGLAEERPAESDGTLGLEVVKVVYAAYLSAAEGRRVDLS